MLQQDEAKVEGEGEGEELHLQDLDLMPLLLLPVVGDEGEVEAVDLLPQQDLPPLQDLLPQQDEAGGEGEAEQLPEQGLGPAAPECPSWEPCPVYYFALPVAAKTHVAVCRGSGGLVSMHMCTCTCVHTCVHTYVYVYTYIYI